jgi:aminopeptidase N
MAKSFERLDTADRVGFLSNLWAQTRAGQLSPEIVLKTLPALDGERDRFVIEQEIDTLRSISDALVADDARPAFRRYVAARLLPHMRAIGPAGTRRDDASALIERALTLALGELAEDDATLKDAARVSLAWLHDPNSVDPDVASIDVLLGSRRAAPDRIEDLRGAIRNAKTPEARTTAIRALGGFGDPETLRRALDVILTDDVKSQDIDTVLGVAMDHRASRKTATDWLMAHWDPVKNKLPSFLVEGMFSVPAYACSKEDRSAATDFFQPRSKDVEGSARPLAEALEAASLCEALRDKYAADVTHFFAQPAASQKAPAPVVAPAPAVTKPSAPPKKPAR